jgi:Amt family ammonium transporter
MARAIDDYGNIGVNLDVLWLLLGAYIVFFMQAGFALLEAGSVRTKNTKNILLKNTLDACLGGLIWWAVGFPFAFGEDGESPNAFIGGTNLFMSDDPKKFDGSFYAFWMFQWAFAAAAATIVSGAVAERCNFSAYLIYTTIITGFIYPVIVHWGWSAEGWLSAFKTNDAGDYDPELGANGLMDFAGSGIVHMVGGGAALMGAIFLGPRAGRFNDAGQVMPMPGHSTVLAALGTFILWFGWYGFNPVSTLSLNYIDIAAKVAVTTTLSAAAGGCTVLCISVAMTGTPDVGPALNGILAGLVSITAPCPVVEPYAAVIIGVLGGFVYYGSSMMLQKMKIDDPLDASPVHFFCGMWGVVSTGLFATKFNTCNVYGTSCDDYGALYGGGGKQLGIQIVGTLAIAVWTCGTSAIMFFALKMMNILRVSADDEASGLDESHHGGAAYNFAAAGAKA